MNEWVGGWVGRRIEHWWDDDEGKPKYLKRNLSLNHFVHHRSQGIKPGCPL